MFADRVSRPFRPVDSIDEATFADAKRWMMHNGVAAQLMETLVMGALLTAFALQLGASNAFIGLIAAIPHLTSLVQLLGVALIERIRNRKLICVGGAAMSRVALLALPVSAFLLPAEAALSVILAALCLRHVMGALVSSSWNPWMRDLVPDGVRGELFGRRLMYMTAMGMAASLAASFFIDRWPDWGGDDIRHAYGILFTGAVLSGFYGVYALARIAEPRMPPQTGPLDLKRRLIEPFRDANFRKLMIFLAAWNFAANLAAPFFTVHMLTRLGIDMFPVMLFATLSQLSNILVLRTFGRIADRMSNKAVLAVTAPLFIACTFAWVFTTATDNRIWVMAILATVHVLTGLATAGVSITTTNIAMKLAPRGNSTAYLATNSLVSSTCAGLAPIIGGLCADFFQDQKLSVILRWETGDRDLSFETIRIEHWDFYFVMAALVGLYSLHRLTMVREEGSIDQRAVISEVFTDARRTIRNVSSIAGLKYVTGFPFDLLVRRRTK